MERIVRTCSRTRDRSPINLFLSLPTSSKLRLIFRQNWLASIYYSAKTFRFVQIFYTERNLRLCFNTLRNSCVSRVSFISFFAGYAASSLSWLRLSDYSVECKSCGDARLSVKGCTHTKHFIAKTGMTQINYNEKENKRNPRYYFEHTDEKYFPQVFQNIKCFSHVNISFVRLCNMLIYKVLTKVSSVCSKV